MAKREGKGSAAGEDPAEAVYPLLLLSGALSASGSQDQKAHDPADRGKDPLLRKKEFLRILANFSE